tara:strand:- start:1084 stop:1626 length:543 start_codon:yes stop_codon:yes gene_type:complete
MPCQDAEAMDYLDDHRTQSLMKETRDLEKQVNNLQKQLRKNKTENELNLEADLVRLNQNNINLAKKLNKTTELLCNATFKMFTHDNETHEKYIEGLWDKKEYEKKPDHILKHGTKLHQWFLEHTEVDANRMKEELDKIMNHKGKTLQNIIKWYSGLDDKEKWVFETHKHFKGIKLKNLLK